MPDQDFTRLLNAQPEEFPRRVLEAHDLPTASLIATDGWSNRVWLTPTHVVRLSSGRFRDAFAHEVAVARLLPSAVPHARVLAYGRAGHREWVIQERIIGRPLVEVWPHLGPDEHASPRPPVHIAPVGVAEYCAPPVGTIVEPLLMTVWGVGDVVGRTHARAHGGVAGCGQEYARPRPRPCFGLAGCGQGHLRRGSANRGGYAGQPDRPGLRPRLRAAHGYARRTAAIRHPRLSGGAARPGGARGTTRAPGRCALRGYPLLRRSSGAK